MVKVKYMRSLLRWCGPLAALLLIPLLVVYGARSVFAYNLSAAEQRWGKSGLVNYRYTLQVRCFCPPPLNEQLVVEVRNGATVRISTKASGEEVPSALLREAGTIPGLFQIIHTAHERSADRLDVSYNEALGYPTRITIDDSTWSIDDESDYRISDLAEIPATNP